MRYRYAVFIVFLFLTVGGCFAACSGEIKSSGHALRAQESEKIQNEFITKRDTLLRRAEQVPDYTPFIETYSTAHHGEAPGAALIAELEATRVKRLLKEAAVYSHLLGMNASMNGDYAVALAFFEEAVRYDPANGTYQEALARAREQAREQAKEK